MSRLNIPAVTPANVRNVLMAILQNKLLLQEKEVKK